MREWIEVTRPRGLLLLGDYEHTRLVEAARVAARYAE